MSNGKPGRPKATYAARYLDVLEKRPGEWMFWTFQDKENGVRIKRWLQREGVAAHQLDLGDELLLAARSNDGAE